MAPWTPPLALVRLLTATETLNLWTLVALVTMMSAPTVSHVPSPEMLSVRRSSALKVRDGALTTVLARLCLNAQRRILLSSAGWELNSTR